MEDQPKPARKISDIGPRRSMDMRPSRSSTSLGDATPTRGTASRPSAPNPRPSVRPASPAQRQVESTPRASAPATRPTMARSTTPRSAVQRPMAAARPANDTSAFEAAEPVETSGLITQKTKRSLFAGNTTMGAIVQFVIGIIIIVLVAAAIVALYVKYYAA